MTATASPYDNATTQSFFRTLKVEEVYMWEYETYSDVIERIPYFIEDVYNSKRLHSSLGYIPPEEFEHIFIEKNSCNVYSELRQVECLVFGVHTTNPYYNAKIESFFRTLKVEEVYMFEYDTYREVVSRIPYFIEEVYNRKRLHSSLGYMPPEEFENINNEKEKENESHQLVLTS